MTAAEANPMLLTCSHPLTATPPLGQAAKPDKTQQLFCQGNLQLLEYADLQTVSQASAQARGGQGKPSSTKMGPHQLYVKLSWNHTGRTGTTWKRKLSTPLFLVIQRQIDTSSET